MERRTCGNTANITAYACTAATSSYTPSPTVATAGTSVGLAGPLTLGTAAKVSAAQARQGRRPTFVGKVTGTANAELFVDASSGRGRLAWETVVSAGHRMGRPRRACTSSAMRSPAATSVRTNEIETVNGTGNGLFTGTVTVDTTLSGSTYTMIDPSHGNGTRAT